MTWWLARQHLRGPQLWLLAALVVPMLLLDTAPMPVPAGLPFLAALLPVLLPAGASAFERTLPLDEGVAERARLVAALGVVAAALAVSALGAALMGRPLFGSTSRQIVCGLAVAGLVAWYRGVGTWVHNRRARQPLSGPRLDITALPVGERARRETRADPARHASLRHVTDAPWRTWWPVVRSVGGWGPILLMSGVAFMVGLAREAPLLLLLGVHMFTLDRGRTAILGVLPLSPLRRTALRIGVPFAALLLAWGAGFVLSDAGANWGVARLGVERRTISVAGPYRGTSPTHTVGGTDLPMANVAGTATGEPWGATTPALTHWERAAGRSSPIVTAPWGESAAADTLTLLGRTLYNPYTVRHGNSQAFADWQLERLAAVHFGEPITYRAYETRANHQLPLPLGRRWPISLLVASMVFAWLLLGVLALELPHHRRLSRWSVPLAVRLLLPITAWALPLAFVFGLTTFMHATRGAALVTPVLEHWAVQLSRAMPPWCVPIAAALPVAAAFALLLWHARFTEPGAEELAGPQPSRSAMP